MTTVRDEMLAREALARGMAPQVQRLLQRWVDQQITLGLSNLGRLEPLAKARSPFELELRELIIRYGGVMLDQSGKAITGRSFGRGRLIEDALKGRDIKLGMVDEWARSADVRARFSLEESRAEVRRLIGDELVKLEQNTTRRLTVAEQAQKVRASIKDHASFSQERAMRITRTELGIAQGVGQEQALQDIGAEESEWLAFPGPRHGSMNGKRAKLGELFTLPSGARARFPHDPRLDVGDLANCRCGRRAVIKQRRR